MKESIVHSFVNQREKSYLYSTNRTLNNINNMTKITKNPTHEEHAEQRAVIAQLWGEPLDAVKGTMYHYDNQGEPIRLFMPFAERETPSIMYRHKSLYKGADKATIRKTSRRTQLTLDIPTHWGIEAMDALYYNEDLRRALYEALENNITESTTHEYIAQ